MEISGKVLREVEFRDRLRGYDTDEVDEFLEKVAVAIDEMQAELSRLASRSPSKPREVDDAASFDDDSIRRTLVLAQRTADLAISEAREEADRLLGEARSQSEAILAQAHEAVRRMRDDAEEELHERVSRLEGERERLERETSSLVTLLEGERARLVQGLTAALRWVDESLAVPGDLARVGDARRGPEGQGGLAQAGIADPVGAVDEDLRGPDGLGAGGRPSLAAREASDPYAVPDVVAEITEDAATAARRDEPSGGGGGVGDPILLDRPQAFAPAPALDADDALWARWASGDGLGEASRSEPSPADGTLRFDRDPGGGRSAS